MGDPHYYNFYGEASNFFGRGLYEQASFALESCGCRVVVQSLHAQVIGGRINLRTNAGIAATALRVGSDTFTITGNGTLTLSATGMLESSLPHAHACPCTTCT